MTFWIYMRILPSTPSVPSASTIINPLIFCSLEKRSDSLIATVKMSFAKIYLAFVSLAHQKTGIMASFFSPPSFVSTSIIRTELWFSTQSMFTYLPNCVCVCVT